MEYFPSYFEQTRGLPKLGEVDLFLVLLATKENWRVVNEYLANFKSAFARTHQVFPKDVLSKTSDPYDNDFYWQFKRTFLVFFNPLKVHQIDINEDIMIQKELLPFHRMAAFQYIESWSDSTGSIYCKVILKWKRGVTYLALWKLNKTRSIFESYFAKSSIYELHKRKSFNPS